MINAKRERKITKLRKESILRTQIHDQITRQKQQKNTQTTRLNKGRFTKYMHHTNKKTIKSQNRNKNTTELFT